MSVEQVNFCSFGVHLFVFHFHNQYWATYSNCELLWPATGEIVYLVSSLFCYGLKQSHPMDHDNGASVRECPRETDSRHPRILGKTSLQSAQETENVIPFGSFPGFIHNRNTKDRVSNGSGIAIRSVQGTRGDLYTTPVVPGITKTPASFTIYPARSIASEDNSKRRFPISEPAVVVGLDTAISQLSFCPEQSADRFIWSVGNIPAGRRIQELLVALALRS